MPPNQRAHVPSRAFACPTLRTVCLSLVVMVLSPFVPSIMGQIAASEATASLEVSTTTASTGDKPHNRSGPSLTGYRGLNAGESFYDSVSRILRNADASYRGAERRWRQPRGGDALERRARRSVVDPRQKRAAEADAVPGDELAEYTLNLTCHRIHRFRNSYDTNITAVDLSCNGITDAGDLSFDHLPAMRLLSLAGNNLTDYASSLLGGCVELRTLDLSANRLTTLNATHYAGLERVERIRMSHNRIETIAVDTFGRLQSLQLLDLSHNHLDSRAVPALQAIPGLVALSVAFNTLLGAALQEFVASWSLKELDASGTGLCRVPAALAQSVHALNVSHNHFEIIRRGDMDSYPLLKYLDMAHNNITDIEDDALGRLEILITLQLQHNLLTTVPTNLPASLVHLLLHANRITDIQPATFAQLSELQTLDLSANRLTYMPGLPLARLLVLNLRSSGLRGLSQTVVQSSPQLKDLLLDGNPIRCPELMSIAEWTTTCRSEPTFDGMVPVVAATQTQPLYEGLLAEQQQWPQCCGAAVRPEMTEKPHSPQQCMREKALPNTVVVDVTKPTKKSRKAKMEDIWRALSADSTTTSPMPTRLITAKMPAASTLTPILPSSTSSPPASESIISPVPTAVVRRRIGKSPAMAAAQSADVRQAKSKRIIVSEAGTVAPNTPATTPPQMKSAIERKKALAARDAMKKPVKTSKINSAFVGTMPTATKSPVKTDESRAANADGKVRDSARVSLATTTTITSTTTVPTKQTTTSPPTADPDQRFATAAAPTGAHRQIDDGTNATTTADNNRRAFAGSERSANPVGDVAGGVMNQVVVGRHRQRDDAESSNNEPNHVQKAATPQTTRAPTQQHEFGFAGTMTAHVNRIVDIGGSHDYVSDAATPHVQHADDVANIYVAEQSLVAAEMAPAPLAVIVHSGHLPLTLNTDHEQQQTAATSGLPEQWNDRRGAPSSLQAGRHPGMFVVAGIAIGMCAALLAVQVVRCARSAATAIDEGGDNGCAGTAEEEADAYGPAGHRDMLPMELLGGAGSTIQYSEAPIELW